LGVKYYTFCRGKTEIRLVSSLRIEWDGLRGQHSCYSKYQIVTRMRMQNGCRPESDIGSEELRLKIEVMGPRMFDLL